MMCGYELATNVEASVATPGYSSPHPATSSQLQVDWAVLIDLVPKPRQPENRHDVSFSRGDELVRDLITQCNRFLGDKKSEGGSLMQNTNQNAEQSIHQRSTLPQIDIYLEGNITALEEAYARQKARLDNSAPDKPLLDKMKVWAEMIALTGMLNELRAQRVTQSSN
jgi:hypothetical protein